MGKSLHALLFFVFGLAVMLGAPTGGRAATLYGSDYVSIGVPDMAQAVAFFRDVLDCRPIGPDLAANGETGTTSSRLLSCDAGSIVELFDTRGASPSPTSSKPAQPLQFVSNDVLRASEWLQHQGVTVSGSPHRLAAGPLAGRTAIDFVSPWGMPLQLLSSKAAASADGSMAENRKSTRLNSSH